MLNKQKCFYFMSFHFRVTFLYCKEYGVKLHLHFSKVRDLFRNISKSDIIDSESPRNENPRNNPKAPPTSAIKDIFGYNQTSSLIDILVLE